MPTAKTQQRRLASLSRWYKANKATGAIVAAEPPSLDTVSLPPGMSEGTRLARRGEFEHLCGSYHNPLTTPRPAKAPYPFPSASKLFGVGRHRGITRGLGNSVRPESHPEPRGFPVQWADPGIKPERLQVIMRSERY